MGITCSITPGTTVLLWLNAGAILPVLCWDWYWTEIERDAQPVLAPRHKGTPYQIGQQLGTGCAGAYVTCCPGRHTS